MASIAEAADVSVGTLYNLFANKEALYAELVTSKAEALHRRIHEAAAQGRSPQERIEHILEAKMAILIEETDFIRFLRFFFTADGHSTLSRKSAPPDRVRELYEQGTRLVADTIAEMLPDHGRREPEAYRLAVVIQSASTELFLLHLEDPETHPAPELLAEAKRQVGALIGDRT